MSGRLSFTPTIEGSSMVPYAGGSISSRSDGSEFDHPRKLILSSLTPQNFPMRRSFKSKAIHPLSFSLQPPTTRPASGSSGSPASTIDFFDISDPGSYEYDSQTQTTKTSNSSSEVSKCGLCERLLSQRSPWSSRRVVKNGDMPVTGVLSCCHVFHADCLEQTTPKSFRSDPPCPLCLKPETENSDKLRNMFPRLRQVSEAGPSRSWGCVEAVDCHRNSLVLLNRNRMKRNLSLKANSGMRRL